jgi:hypothetical protein
MLSAMKATTQAILSELANAGEGVISGLPISEHLYPEESVRAAVAAYSRYCHVDWAKQDDGQLRLSISLLPGVIPEGRNVVGEFLNFMLNHALSARWRRDYTHD